VARVVMTADNGFECWINGRYAGKGKDWHVPYDLDLVSWFRPGDNLIAVAAVNSGERANPAGLIGAVQLEFRDGSKMEVHTDASWESALSVDAAWTNAASAAKWQPALELGGFGMEPWGEVEARTPPPSYFTDPQTIGHWLGQQGLPPDFSYRTRSSEQSLRFTHRATDDMDIYFVANRTPHPEQAVCSFRVQNKRPEFWWPESCRVERPAVYDLTNGCVQVPLGLEPHGSIFVVFRAKDPVEPDRITSVRLKGQPVLDTATPATSGEFELLRGHHGELLALTQKPGHYVLTLADGGTRHVEVAPPPPPVEVGGPWQVRFAPGWGAPEQANFEELLSWSEHADPGIKYFSGSATYTRHVQLPPVMLAKNQRLFLDLGDVQVMAEVMLNGQALGILWKRPFRMEITGAAKPGDNTLEVKVVNLWPNRMIGDEQLPEDSERVAPGTDRCDGRLQSWPQWLLDGRRSPAGRFTFSTWRLWRKNDPLQKSGLLGPVRIVSAEQISVRDPAGANN
jgi:hypothetical protein